MLTPPDIYIFRHFFCRSISWICLCLANKELDFSPRKVGAITAQAKRLNAIAERSGLPVEVSHEKVSAVQSEAMGVHDRRRNGRLVGLAEAGE